MSPYTKGYLGPSYDAVIMRDGKRLSLDEVLAALNEQHTALQGLLESKWGHFIGVEDGLTEAGLVAGEAYQVIGALSHYANMFDDPEVQRALDWFSGFEPGVTYKDDASILPWPRDELKAESAELATENAALPPASGAEPVAWRHRVRTVAEHPWSEWRQGKGAGCYHPVVMVDEQPLYTAPTPPSASSGDGELTRQDQEDVLNFAINTSTPGQICSEASFVLDALHAAGYRIVRTAPSGEQG